MASNIEKYEKNTVSFLVVPVEWRHKKIYEVDLIYLKGYVETKVFIRSGGGNGAAETDRSRAVPGSLLPKEHERINAVMEIVCKAQAAAGMNEKLGLQVVFEYFHIEWSLSLVERCNIPCLPTVRSIVINGISS